MQTLDWIASKVRAGKFGAVHTHAAHGSRFKRPSPKPFIGVLKKKKGGSKHVLGGILGGKSIESNWSEYRFQLNFRTSELSYFNLNSKGGVAADVLCLDFRSEIIENGHSSSKGHPKISITGSSQNCNGQIVMWELKMGTESQYNAWVDKLKSACRPRWEENRSSCALCRARFGFKLSNHHCRRCGKCVCHPCSDNWSDEFNQRICQPCNLEVDRNSKSPGITAVSD
jgi:hypothetical protein